MTINNQKINIKEIFFPEVDAEVQANMNGECIRNIYRLSIAGMIFMTISLVVFILSLDRIDSTTGYRVGKFILGFLVCMGGFLISRGLAKKEAYSQVSIDLFAITYCILLASWAIIVSYYEYRRGEQLLIFFATELLMVCFMPLRPVVAAVFSLCQYAVLYATLYSIDGAKGILPRNYAVLIAISITGMIVIYHSRVRMSRREVALKKSLELLDYTARHDALTGLRNRKALNEDVADYTVNTITVFMMDINYFKVLNDTYGHVIGDAVLKEAAKKINETFPESTCYRYGGDEFLVAGVGCVPFDEISIRFSVDEAPDETIVISVGRADGNPKNDREFFSLVSEADEKLYESKKITHTA